MILFISNSKDSMKKFFVDICIGVITFCIVWAVIEYLLIQANILNSYSYKYKYVKNNPAIKTLLIGHSHFANSINPYLMGDSVFDFAISGRRWIYWDTKLAEQLFPSMQNLKTVVFPLGYAMPYESPHYYPHSEVLIQYMFMYSKYMNLPYDRFPQNYIYRSALLSNTLGINYWIDCPQDSLGYEKYNGQGPLLNGIEETNILWNSDTTTLCYNEFKEYFIQLAKTCYENNIRFIAVTCPCADCYVANTCEQGIHNLYALVDSVATHYPIEYHNYLDDVEFRADSLYYNSSHMNSIGADKFALRVKKDFGL